VYLPPYPGVLCAEWCPPPYLGCTMRRVVPPPYLPGYTMRRVVHLPPYYWCCHEAHSAPLCSGLRRENSAQSGPLSSVLRGENEAQRALLPTERCNSCKTVRIVSFRQCLGEWLTSRRRKALISPLFLVIS